MPANLQLDKIPIDFSWIEFIAFKHWIYGKLDYELTNVHFILDSLRTTYYSDPFLSRALNKKILSASHVVYWVSSSTIAKTDWSKNVCF